MNTTLQDGGVVVVVVVVVVVGPRNVPRRPVFGPMLQKIRDWVSAPATQKHGQNHQKNFWDNVVGKTMMSASIQGDE